MRVVIEVVAGPLAGRRYHLIRNQRLQIGSTADADVCVRGDSLLAPLHLQLETDYQVCRVRDLAGQGSTIVNGAPVELAIVRTGDQIKAGNSAFVLHIEGDVQEAPPEALPVLPVGAAGRSAPAAAKAGGEIGYKAVTCNTELTRYEVDARQFPPGALVAALQAEWPVVLVADNRRLHEAALEKLERPHYLFSWLGEAAKHVSPLVVLPGEVDDPAGMVARGWRRDGVVCFFAKEPDPSVAEKLQSAARASNNSVIGICWPSVLEQLLSHYRPDYVKQLIEPFRAVLVEDSTAHDCWHLFSAEPLDEKLQAIGLKPETASA
jgi:hypothetical protein